MLLVARRAARLDEVARDDSRTPAVRAKRSSIDVTRARCAGTHRRHCVARLRAHRRRRQQRRRRRVRRVCSRRATRRSRRSGTCTSPRRCALRAQRCRTSNTSRGSLASSSVRASSRVPLPAFGAYAPAKAAIRAAAMQLRRELRPRGIAVTYVDPGVVDTEFHGRAGHARDPSSASKPPRPSAWRARSCAASAAAPRSSTPFRWQTAGTIARRVGGDARRSDACAYSPHASAPNRRSTPSPVTAKAQRLPPQTGATHREPRRVRRLTQRSSPSRAAWNASSCRGIF